MVHPAKLEHSVYECLQKVDADLKTAELLVPDAPTQKVIDAVRWLRQAITILGAQGKDDDA